MSLAARKSDRSTKAALQRVLHARAQRGLDEITRHGTGASTHELRKRCKELRGLLHLLRPGLTEGKALDRRLRDAARMLASHRDIQVMLTTFDAVTARLRTPQNFAGLRWQIIDVAQEMPISGKEKAIENYTNSFSMFHAAVKELSLRDKASNLMWESIFSTLSRGHRLRTIAQIAAETDMDAAPFHDWRKAVKQHWYQARFLQKIAPPEMQAHIERVDSLSETLGDHNDLDVLATFLNARPELCDADRHALTIFNRHLLARRRALAAEALLQADATFATPPKRLVKRWRKTWRRWRKG